MIKKYKILFILNHAAEYREPFLRELSKFVNLEVVAQPCEADSIIPPETRLGYKYTEIPSLSIGFIKWQKSLKTTISKSDADIICSSLNMRHISRMSEFIKYKKKGQYWIWWGYVLSRTGSRIVEFIRGLLIKRSNGCLVFNEPIAKEISNRYKVLAMSFNNTQCRLNEFKQCDFPNDGPLKLLFVGTNKPRKQIDRLIGIVNRRQDIKVRLVGNNLESLKIPHSLIDSGYIQIFGPTVGEQLIKHFEWADIVANPGSVGLLVMNAAKHGKGIIIDKNSFHGAEYWLAVEADQPFIDFENQEEVDQWLDHFLKDRKQCKVLGQRLQAVAKQKYTIESMAKRHVEFFGKLMEC